MITPFKKNLQDREIDLHRDSTHTLQINIGSRCNLSCRHCHLNAGPWRTEVMSRKTMGEVLDFARRCNFLQADVTGGAPELVPDIGFLLHGLRPFVDKLILRSNLVLLLEKEYAPLLHLCRSLKISIVASFPSTNENQADAQRGKGVWHKSVAMLRRLNELGYGQPGSDLELFLVSNPAGAFLPTEQCKAEKKFKADLARKWGIAFTGLFTFANVPLGRFHAWLEQSGNLDEYLARLAESFNPQTIDGLMCRSLISVSWDGYLYDCDFNLAAGLPYSGNRIHISEVDGIEPGIPVMTDDYCYACTAGSGFT
jgi:radical SAM/Cys-rich protein